MKSLLSFLNRKAAPKPRQSTAIGKFPARKSSLVSLVLAKLIVGEKLNSVDFAVQANTSRLKDLIASLRKQYGWCSIESNSIAKATPDGRVQWVSQYWLPHNLLDILNTPSNDGWVKSVCKVHRFRKLHAKAAFNRAMACNAKKTAQSSNTAGDGK